MPFAMQSDGREGTDLSHPLLVNRPRAALCQPVRESYRAGAPPHCYPSLGRCRRSNDRTPSAQSVRQVGSGIKAAS